MNLDFRKFLTTYGITYEEYKNLEEVKKQELIDRFDSENAKVNEKDYTNFGFNDKIKAEKTKVKKSKNNIKKPFYKRWWFVALIIIVLIRAIGGGDKDKVEEAVKIDKKQPIVVDDVIPSEEDVISSEEDVIPGEIIDVNYLLMWNDYNKEIYNDKYLRLAGKIDYIGENTINIKEGLTGITGNIYLTFDKNNTEQLESLSEGDYIIITGKNKGKISGQISIHNVSIEAVGDEALQKTNEYKEEADIIFEKQRIEAQELEKEEMAEYKTKANVIKYESLIREPNKYEGDIIKITIKISQIMGGGILTDAGYSGKQGSNEWYISYKLPEHSARILEGDSITFYGEFDGVVEMKRALTNSKVYIPRLKAKYFE